jgi:hypothetical protein
LIEEKKLDRAYALHPREYSLQRIKGKRKKGTG